MPILANAKKALRASQRKAKANALVKSQMRTSVKNHQAKPSQDTLSLLYSQVDLAVKNNLIHPNKAARMKAQASRQLSATA